MKSQKKTVVQKKEITVFIAEDGTEFDNMNDCLAYEEEWKNKLLDESPNIIECKEAEDCMPFDGNEYYENHEYRWFKPLNSEGVNLINRLFDILLNISHIGKWVCLEFCDDDIYTSLLDDSIDYAKRMFELFSTDEELEYMLNFVKSAEEPFDYNNDSELKTLRVLWTAYCLHKNLDADTDKYTDKLDKIWSALENNINDNKRVKFEIFMSEYLR